MQGFKSAILAEWKNYQNGTFEPVHEIQKSFWQKYLFVLWQIWEQGNLVLRFSNLYQLVRQICYIEVTLEKAGVQYVSLSWRLIDTL